MHREFFEMFPLIVFIMAFYGIFGALAIAKYIINAVGIMRISTARGLSNGWFGFIPIAAQYQIGKIAGEVSTGKKKIKNPGLWLLIILAVMYGVFYVTYFSVFAWIFSSISRGGYGRWNNGPEISMVFAPIMLMLLVLLVIIVCSYAYSILYIMTLNKIYVCNYETPQALFYTLLSGYIPLALGILLMKAAKAPIINPPEYMTGSGPLGNYPPQPPYAPTAFGGPTYPQPPYPPAQEYTQAGYVDNRQPSYVPPVYGAHVQQQPVVPPPVYGASAQPPEQPAEPGLKPPEDESPGK